MERATRGAALRGADWESKHSRTTNHLVHPLISRQRVLAHNQLIYLVVAYESRQLGSIGEAGGANRGRNWMKKGMKDRPRCPQSRAAAWRRRKALHCLRSVAHPARQDLFGSLREEGRPEGPGS